MRIEKKAQGLTVVELEPYGTCNCLEKEAKERKPEGKEKLSEKQISYERQVTGTQDCRSFFKQRIGCAGSRQENLLGGEKQPDVNGEKLPQVVKGRNDQHADGSHGRGEQ